MNIQWYLILLRKTLILFHINIPPLQHKRWFDSSISRRNNICWFPCAIVKRWQACKICITRCQYFIFNFVYFTWTYFLFVYWNLNVALNGRISKWCNAEILWLSNIVYTCNCLLVMNHSLFLLHHQKISLWERVRMKLVYHLFISVFIWFQTSLSWRDGIDVHRALLIEFCGVFARVSERHVSILW
jgi:hypothetical protein